MEFFQANIKFGEVLVQIIAFLIVFFALKKMVWKNLLAGLESRREKIEREFAKIESTRREIEKLKAEYTAYIAKIDEESRSKIQQAVDEGRKIAREIQDKARSESQASFEKAKENLTLEITKARLTLRREIADLAILTSEKIIREKLNDAKQQEKVLEILGELEKTL